MGAAIRSLALLGQFLHNMRAAIRSLTLLGQFLHNMGAAIRSRALLGQFLHSMGAAVRKLWEITEVVSKRALHRTSLVTNYGSFCFPE